MQAKRELRLDALKGISCLIVALFHIRLPGVVGDAIIYGLRFPVPIFFMISGFFGYGRDRAWFMRHVRSLLAMLFVWDTAYAVFYSLGAMIMERRPLLSFLAERLGLEQLIIATVCRGYLFAGHLWYLYAAAIALLLVSMLRDRGLLDRTSLVLSAVIVLLLIQSLGHYVFELFLTGENGFGSFEVRCCLDCRVYLQDI